MCIAATGRHMSSRFKVFSLWGPWLYDSKSQYKNMSLPYKGHSREGKYISPPFCRFSRPSFGSLTIRLQILLQSIVYRFVELFESTDSICTMREAQVNACDPWLKCVAVCCSARHVAVWRHGTFVLQCVAVCCSVLYGVAFDPWLETTQDDSSSLGTWLIPTL